MSENNNPQDLMDEEYEPDLIYLEDDAGVEHVFEVIDAADINGNRYLALVPYEEADNEEDEEPTEMLLMRVDQEEDGSEFLYLLEEEDELAEIGEAFYNRLSEVYNIDLDDLGKPLQ